MVLFGKGRSQMEVIAADFLPYEKQLHIIVADADCNLHVLQFDPERESSPTTISYFPINISLPTPPNPQSTHQANNRAQTPNPSQANASSINPPSTPATSPHASPSSAPHSPPP
jgi:CPSF A subunit region